MSPPLQVAVFLVSLFLCVGGQQFGGCRSCSRQVSYQVTVYKLLTNYRQTCTGGSWFRRRRCSTVTTYRSQSMLQTRYWKHTFCCPDDLFPDVPVADGVLRLQEGSSLNEGRLEIRYKNLFGGVCDDNFGASEAATACHQLGFAGAERVVPCCHGQRRHGEIWLDDVDCNSGEVWLYNCTHGGWGVEDCHFMEEVGVKCNDSLNIRLADCGNPFEGRVEQFYAGSWSTVCDDGWDLNDAKVVCRQLGLGGAVRATTGSFFGQGTGRAILSNVDCTGNETALGWCLHSGWISRSCSQTAGVVCEGPTSKNLKVVWVTSTAVHLRFELPTQLQYTNLISGYEVVYTSQGEAASTVFIEVAQSQIAKPQLTLSGLTPHTQYTLKVCIVAVCAQSIQRGPISELITTTTMEAAPGPVASLSGSTTSPTEGVLLWTPPLSPNGIVTGYRITGSTHNSTGNVIVSSDTRSYEFSGLRSKTQYNFTVAAVNGAGQGQATTVSIQTCGCS